MSVPAVPGVYGKVPALGDFVSRRLPSGFVSTWDAWIQEAFTISRQQLEADWLDIYLTSPVWRFIMTSGSCGEKASAGILMPSVDKVGRYFPLTLAAVLDDRIDLPYLFTTAAGWFDALEQLALLALEDDFPLDLFDRQLKTLQLEPPISTDGGKSSRRPQSRIDKRAPIRIEMQTLSHLPQAFKELAICLLERQFFNYSLWSTEGSDLLKPSLLIYQGLPPPTDFSGFLTGDWLRFGESQAIAVSPFFFHLEDTPDESAAPDNDRHAAVRVQWQSFGLSHVGMVRTLNEDAFLTIPEAGIWAVADGMGGHLAGDEASRAVVDGLSAVGAGSTLEALIAEVTDSLQATNKELRQRAQGFENGQIMGSTVVVMLAVDNQCATIWAGDSRLYRYRRGCLSQLTRDHSPEGELENPNQQAPSNQNSSNVITRALGAEQELRLDMLTFEAGPGDTYLLCSDGLVKALTVDEIETILTQPDPEKCSRSLIDLALEKKARDNVTVVVINSDHTGVNPLGRK